MITLKDRYRGVLVGLAVGDAVGTTNEFTPRDKVVPINDMVGGGQFELKAGQWTDDTSMALCLADSIIANPYSFNLVDQVERYIKWYRYGYNSSTGECFDIGLTTASALQYYELNEDIELLQIYNSGDETSGAGGIMRLAPIPMAYMDSCNLLSYAIKSSTVTHASRDAKHCAMYLAALIRRFLKGDDKTAIYKSGIALTKRFKQEATLSVNFEKFIKFDFLHDTIDNIETTGYCVDCLTSALWVFHNTDSFEEGCIKLANMGDDSDTTCAVYGQIAGAYYGYRNIPTKWATGITQYNDIIERADKLYRMNTAVSSILKIIEVISKRILIKG